ncbi:MAG: CPBP family intramembrane metalloprotease [Anaerolineae bacterium]|nr:CPBP family intramembrane metalloprotease [Anaerolineae bacterium]
MPGNFLFATLFPGLLSGVLIWLWPCRWTDEVCYPQPSESQRQLRRAWTVFVVTFGLILLLILVSPRGYGVAHQRDYGLADVIGQAIVWGIVLLPMYFGAKADGLKWRDLQYRRSNILSSLVLGTMVGMIFLVGAGKVTCLPMLFTVSGVFAGLQYLIVGFAEETLFRGYIQIRWEAVSGRLLGILLASVVMSLFHLPTLLVGGRLSILSTLDEVLRMMPLSLLLGYAMHKSGNIVAPSIIHLWLNWIQIL